MQRLSKQSNCHDSRKNDLIAQKAYRFHNVGSKIIDPGDLAWTVTTKLTAAVAMIVSCMLGIPSLITKAPCRQGSNIRSTTNRLLDARRIEK